MGCRVSSQESLEQTITTSVHPPNMSHDEVDYKSRLERKLVLAKDTPEPEYDLSDCNLKDVSPGVFIMCRILLKEKLDLSKNKLHNLHSGGSLRDLSTIQILNLSYNKLKKLPDDIFYLENLREFYLLNNSLETLPHTINKLKKLELLDLSSNKLTSIEPVQMMPCLRILNISNNKQLRRLPFGLATCDSLNDIMLDADNLVYPPPEVSLLGTQKIIEFLMENCDSNLEPNLDIEKITERFIAVEKYEIPTRIPELSDKYRREKEMLELERAAQEKNYMLEAQLHQEQQRKKHELLEEMRLQQQETDSMVNDLQKAKDMERSRLINNILEREAQAALIVEHLMQFQNGPDPFLIEREQEEQEELLQKLQNQQCDLRRQEVLSAMTELLNDEANIISMYQVQRDESSRDILQRENETNIQLENAYNQYDKHRSEFFDELIQNEALQKGAVAALIVNNDSRSWALIEQVRIIEAELVKMTYYELEKKKITAESSVDELAEVRINLTSVLVELLDQQEKRRLQLFETLRYIEEQNEENRKDFWLMQYQKLIDSHPTGIATQTSGIDPLLGYNFLVNGVVHCLPFLSKFWQTCENKNLETITDADLTNAGIHNEKDRRNILKSIAEFVHQESKLGSSSIMPSTSMGSISAIASVQATKPAIDDTEIIQNECVVCMERESQIVFLPCGHLCCCHNCQVNLIECPICRGKLERRVKLDNKILFLCEFFANRNR